MAIFLYFFIFLLSFCEVFAGTNEDAEKHVGPSRGQPHDPKDDIAKIFTIQTAIKFSDGGHVMMLDEVTFGEITWGKRYKRPIEEVLKYANGIEGVEYQPYTEADKMDFKAKVRATGRLRFTKTIEKIRVQRKRDGPMEEVDFYIEEGETTTVRRIVQKLQKIDWRWSILHGYQNQKNHLFEVGFTGHFTLILLEKKAEKDELEEIVRFHFTPNGLRIFRKSKGNKDYVIEADLSETEQPSSAVTNAEGRRGVYEKFNFPKPLMTEKYSITQLKQIGLNIVGGRKLDDQKFDCRAWGYLFILAIVPKERAKELRDLRNWPMDVQLEEEQFYQMGVPRMFKKYVPHFDYEKWIKQSAEVKKNDKNVNRKNERKDG